MSAPIQIEPESSTGSDAEHGHVHTCIIHHEVRVQRATCPPKLHSMDTVRATHTAQFTSYKRVTKRDYLRVYFGAAHTERSGAESVGSL